MKPQEFVAKLAEKKAQETAVKEKYTDKEKSKKLTTDERLSRLEELMGLDK